MAKEVRGIDWAAIFHKRPDLSPPGYKETVDKIKSEKKADGIIL